MIDERVLEILRCPITHEPLVPADRQLVDRVSEAIGEGKLVNRIGEVVSRSPDEGLCSEAKVWFYPIHNNIPCLIPDEAIPVDQLDAALIDATEQQS